MKFSLSFALVYIDYILIYFWNEAEHCQHVSEVLQKLCKHHLYLKVEKCLFHQTSIQFLSYVIGLDGIRIDERKVEAIMSWPTS